MDPISFPLIGASSAAFWRGAMLPVQTSQRERSLCMISFKLQKKKKKRASKAARKQITQTGRDESNTGMKSSTNSPG